MSSVTEAVGEQFVPGDTLRGRNYGPAPKEEKVEEEKKFDHIEMGKRLRQRWKTK